MNSDEAVAISARIDRAYNGRATTKSGATVPRETRNLHQPIQGGRRHHLQQRRPAFYRRKQFDLDREPDGSVKKIADVHRHLGQARIGKRDILACDFGPTNIFQDDENEKNDGIVWRITPEGNKTVVATGIADPNAVLVLKNGTLLVSDDGVDKIYQVKKGKVSVWSNAVAYPNGLALSPDDKTLYVAQIFSALKPKIVGDDRVWSFELNKNGSPRGQPKMVARTGGGGIDGLVTDERGRIYIADNGAGKVFRFDPNSSETILIAEGMPGVASLVFGEGKFDRTAIYATSTLRGGGKIYKISVGVRGALLHR